MRFVELRTEPDGESFRLHPRITVLRGLTPADRVAVVGLAHDVALGEPPDWDGTVEIDGEQMSLLAGIECLGVSAESALIVAAASLPTPCDDAGRGPHATSSGGDDLASAEEKRADLDERIASLAEELAAAGKVRSEIVANLASAKARIDPEVGERLDRADGALGRAARRAERPDPWTGCEDPAERLAALRELVGVLDAQLDGLPSGDRPALAAAVAAARAATSSGPVPSPEATALAQAWTSLHQRLRGLESRMEAAGGGTEAAAARLEQAQVAFNEAEDAALPRPITPEESARLEELHDRMLEAESKAGRGMRRGAGRAAYDQAEAELQAALAPLGYPTWAAFRMGNGMAAVPPEAVVAYEEAQQALDVAEAEWGELMDRIDRDTELQDVLQAIDKALEHAVEMLDEHPYADGDRDPARVTEALEAVRVDALEVGVDRQAGMAHLREALSAAGAKGHEELISDAAVLALGDSWLGVLASADEAAVRLLRDRERATEELAALEAMGDGKRLDRLQSERAEVRALELEVAETRQALTDVVTARLKLHVLAATELHLAEEHDDRVVQRESAQVLVELAERRADGRAAADAATEFAERVPRGLGGPIPVVVVMGDAPAATLDRLAVLPADVQVLVIGDADGIEDWVRDAGDETAALVDVASLV